MYNEETIIESPSQNNNEKKDNSWAKVTLGGVSGILMGAGLIFGAQQVFASKGAGEEGPTIDPQAKEGEETSQPQEDSQATKAEDQGNTAIDINGQVGSNHPQLAEVHNNLSFGDAFAAARAEVGPGGVFYWHGGLYNTYTKEEWNSLPIQEKANFASHVDDFAVSGHHVHDMGDHLSFGDAFAAARAEVGPGGVFYWHGGLYNTYTEAEWNAMSAEAKADFAHDVHHAVPTTTVYVVPTDDSPVVEVPQADPDPDVVFVNDQLENNFSLGEDVHIVGFTDTTGHLEANYDFNNDGNADVAIVDVDDNLRISDPDLIVDTQGNFATVNEVVEEPANLYSTEMEDPGTNDDVYDVDNMMTEV